MPDLVIDADERARLASRDFDMFLLAEAGKKNEIADRLLKNKFLAPDQTPTNRAATCQYIAEWYVRAAKTGRKHIHAQLRKHKVNYDDGEFHPTMTLPDGETIYFGFDASAEWSYGRF